MTQIVNLTLIKKVRGEKGFTQQYMAQELGLKDKSKYSRRENGEYSFQLEELPKLVEVLEIPYEKIFTPIVAKTETKKEVAK